MQEYMNEATVRGNIASISRTARSVDVTIVTKTNGIKNYPCINFRKDFPIDDFKVGDNVTVFGYIQNHVTTRENGKMGSRVAFIGEEIFHAKRFLCDYFDDPALEDADGGFPEDRNEVVFIGDVVSLYAPKDQEFAIIKAACNEKKHKGQCDMSCFARISALAKRVKADDKVAMVGYLSTKTTYVSGHRVTVMDIVCRDICKIN